MHAQKEGRPAEDEAGESSLHAHANAIEEREKSEVDEQRDALAADRGKCGGDQTSGRDRRTQKKREGFGFECLQDLIGCEVRRSG